MVLGVHVYSITNNAMRDERWRCEKWEIFCLFFQTGPSGNDVDATIISGAPREQASQAEAYQAFEGSPPEYPITPPQVVQVNSGLPPWVWVVVGVLLANVFNKVEATTCFSDLTIRGITIPSGKTLAERA